MLEHLESTLPKRVTRVCDTMLANRDVYILTAAAFWLYCQLQHYERPLETRDARGLKRSERMNRIQNTKQNYLGYLGILPVAKRIAI